MAGGGAGSMQHMITTLRNNKNLLKQVKHSQKHGNNKIRYSKHVDLEFKNVTEDELNSFRIELQKKIRIQIFKNGLALTVSILIVAGIILLIYQRVFIS